MRKNDREIHCCLGEIKRAEFITAERYHKVLCLLGTFN